MTEPVLPPAELVRLLVTEGKRRIVALSLVFSVVALGALALGVLLPKEYETHAVLLADTKNIIAPLMAGRAVQTTGSEDAHVVRQAFLSRRVLREVLVAGGWGEVKDPLEEARALTKIAPRIRLQSPRPELIRISYRDTDPRRCLTVANKLAEIYIRESTAGKGGESREAFAFIDRQAKEYAAKVEEAHAKVLAHQRTVDARARGAGTRPQQASAPRLAPEQLAALTVEEAALAAELSSSEARQGRHRRAERTAQLERELEVLLTSYTENHPNVKRAREELRIQRLEAEKATAADDAATAGVRRRLEAVRARIAASASLGRRAAEPPESDPELRNVGHDSLLSELVRRYEAARQVYQDLLVRRENARVSMALETERGEGAVRVYESPELPVVATGLRLMHISVIGLLLAVLAPVGLLLALLRLDPRVRSPRQLERFAHVPLLVGIPGAPRLGERLRRRRDALLAAGVVAAVLATYVGFFIVKVKLGS